MKLTKDKEKHRKVCKNVKQTSTKYARSDKAEEFIRAIRDIALSYRHQVLINHDQEKMPPKLTCAW